jgi:PAS domain S-box-containing protein
MTADGDDEKIDGAFKAGGVDFIIKPVRKNALLARVKTHISILKNSLELSEEKEKTRKYLDIVGVIVFALDENANVTMVNSYGCKTLGMTREEILGKNWIDNFIPSSERAEVKYVFNQIIKGNINFPEFVENCVLAKNGEKRLISWRNRVIRDENGKITGTMSSGEDITERRKNEKKLYDVEKRFKTFFEYAPIGKSITAPDGKLLDVNAAFCSMLGYSKQEMETISFAEITHPDDVAKSSECVRSLLCMERDSYTMEKRYIHKNGEVVWTHVATRLFKDDDNKPFYFLTHIIDITDRKQIEMEISIQSKIRTIFLLSDDADMFGEILNVILEPLGSNYGFLGYVDETGALVVPAIAEDIFHDFQVPGKGVVFPKDVWGKSSCLMSIEKQKMILSDNPPINVFKGQPKVERFISTPIIFHNEIVGLLQIANKSTPYTDNEINIVKGVVDIIAPVLGARKKRNSLERERQLKTEELAKLNRELDQRVAERTTELMAINKELEAFSYSVSHDLRAPLRSIDGFSKVLIEDYSDILDETAKDYLNRVCGGAQRMGLLIDDMLKLSRLNRTEMSRQHLDLNNIATQIIKELRLEEPQRVVDFKISGELAAYGDKELIKVALENLLRNAWKFTGMRKHGHIEMGMVEQNGETVFYVRDDGAGFDMAYIHKLFSAFQRLHSPSEFKGSGIGLAIVKRVITRHGGKIWAEGKEDAGAVFHFTLNDLKR